MVEAVAPVRTRSAAFYDVEGTLVRTNVVHSYAYYAVNVPRLSERVWRFGSLLATIPVYWLVDKVDRRLFNEQIYLQYKGMSEDRLTVIGEEFFEKVLKKNVYPGARDLISRSQEVGHLQVLVTGALNYVMDPLARWLGMDHWVTNRLEVVNGEATGHLMHPILAGPKKAGWVLDFASREGIDLSRSFAYADSASDTPMLSVVGNPVAVNPDFRLRSTARANDWPVMKL